MDAPVLYQIDSNVLYSLQGKEVTIYEQDGQIRMVLQGEKQLDFHKWEERSTGAPPTINVKELEVLKCVRKRTRPNYHHPWRATPPFLESVVK